MFQKRSWCTWKRYLGYFQNPSVRKNWTICFDKAIRFLGNALRDDCCIRIIHEISWTPLSSYQHCIRSFERCCSQKNMIWKPGSQVIMHTESLYLAPTVQISKQEILKSGVELKKQIINRKNTFICLMELCVLLKEHCAAFLKIIKLKKVSESQLFCKVSSAQISCHTLKNLYNKWKRNNKNSKQNKL